MAAVDLGSAEWERSKISTQDVNLLKKLGISKKPKALCFPSEESYPTPPMGYRVSFIDHLIRGLSAPIHPFLRGLLFVYGLQLHHLTPNSILHISIFITLCEAFLGVQPNWALWKRIFFCRRNGSPNVAYNIGSVVISVRPTIDYFDVKLPDSNHPNLVSLPPLPEGGDVEERAIVTDDNQDAPSFVNEPMDSLKSAGSSEKEAASEGTTSAQSPPPAVSPRNKRKRNGAEDSGTFKAEEVGPSRHKAIYDPYLESLISSDDEEEIPTLDVAARTSTSHTLVVSETPVEGEESSPPQLNVGAPTPPSSPLVPLPKRTRVETVVEPTLQLGSSSNPLLDDPMIQELVRIGAQFVGYREYASKTEEKLAEANKLVDTLAQKLEQSETARKKAELDASQAKAEAEEAKAKAAGVEDLQKRLDDAETALNEHKAAQATREKAIIKRLTAQNRRFLGKTNQDFELEDPDNDPLLDALSFLEFHGTEVREGMEHADAGLSRLFPYFFPKKEEPKTFLALAKDFNPPEDLGLKMRHENMKIAVESIVALVADSQQTVDWTKVGDTDQIEQAKWRSLIKAAKPNTKKILAYLGIKPSSTPSSSRPEV
ncbi:hypothetical protein QYE76_028841 [Lolium multiflorum]|uniref:Transposase (putative) gypsy type domain-containing protein n=1 Tax=Lolium multiflorum TaxID=4521 RepID=A0AAD8QLQ0_LOLMU|nr:hypothetical protein QYE76_028841 [Lolium multiflorum]